MYQIVRLAREEFSRAWAEESRRRVCCRRVEEVARDAEEARQKRDEHLSAIAALGVDETFLDDGSVSDEALRQDLKGILRVIART